MSTCGHLRHVNFAPYWQQRLGLVTASPEKWEECPEPAPTDDVMRCAHGLRAKLEPYFSFDPNARGWWHGTPTETGGTSWSRCDSPPAPTDDVARCWALRIGTYAGVSSYGHDRCVLETGHEGMHEHPLTNGGRIRWTP